MKLLLRIILLPFALLYGFVLRFRNLLFNIGILPEKTFDIPVISIGNISTGGTGKTPLAEYLASILQEENFTPAIISRGYKREQKGLIIAGLQHTASDIGDEPFQLKQKFPDLTVIVSENRVKAVRKVINEMPRVDVVILDDAFQHRFIKPGLNILTTQYSKPFSEDWLLPAGTLREPKSSKKRADIIVATKSLVVLSPFEVGRLKEEIKPLRHQDLYFSYIAYGDMVDYHNPSNTYPVKDFEDYKLVLFTGIANPAPIQSYLERKCKAVDLIKFADHKSFSQMHYDKVAKRYKEIFVKTKAVVTTEKDAKRLQNTEIGKQFKQLPLYYLPMEIGFHQTEDTTNFDERIINYVRKNQRNRPLHSGKN